MDRIWALSAVRGKPGLERMRRLLEWLNHPEEELKVIHIAGTNGKGSIAQMLASVLRAGGYHVGVYTSPHVMTHHERFQLDGDLISDEDFCKYAEMAFTYEDRLVAEGLGHPAEFEILTAMAFLYFRDKMPDFVILETGIGGRIDMTNTVRRPLIGIIAQIGFDHRGTLGDTLPEIAGEKAGIIKHGVPVVSESPEEEVKAVLRKRADEEDAFFLDASLVPYEILSCKGRMRFRILPGEGAEQLGLRPNEYELGLLGEHQVRNAVTVLTALRNLEDRGCLKLSEETVKNGLREARNMGRFEVMRENPDVILDAGHNPQGIAAAMKTLHGMYGASLSEKRVLIVFGCFKDKDYSLMLDELARGLKDTGCERVIATEPPSPRALEAATLAALLCEEGIHAEACPDLQLAYRRAMEAEADIKLFLGSIYLIGDIRTLLSKERMQDHV